MGINKKDTLSYRNQMIYQVFVRNYSGEGTFKALQADLERIRALGTDILYLMPIQPIGVKARKGTFGSPYAIKDYTGISPDLGTLNDFIDLIKATHSKGMKIILDIVFHHTARDHHWVKEHPGFYFFDEKGELKNKVGDWWDIADLNFDVPQVHFELVKVLLYWMDLGLDGFRFDVPSLLPLDFLLEAKQAMRNKNPEIFLLGESVDSNYVDYLRYHGFGCLSDSECFQVFDALYEYDTRIQFNGYFEKKNNLEAFRNALRMQERIYPVDYVKARNVENHDNQRIRFYTGDHAKSIQWIAYCFISKGIAFLQYGIETGTDHLPNLFEKDPVDWSRLDDELIYWIQGLAKMKKNPIFAQNKGYKIVSHEEDVLHFEYENDDNIFVGILNVGNETGILSVDHPDGVYTHLITGKKIEIVHGSIALMDRPICFMLPKERK
ncbi:MAG: alpha-amylase [Erysipelotrichales bacterium]|nr:MAG: alpha-amylase [Erysipelotrichales bacterium]